LLEDEVMHRDNTEKAEKERQCRKQIRDLATPPKTKR
jgi:hypothetical protein